MTASVFFLPDSDAALVEKNLQKKSLNVWYEAKLLAERGKSKKVYCYIFPRVSVCVCAHTCVHAGRHAYV